tara:strand:+ start:412 stop:678 length:267 start_codon:yes stop_codon:yes gene_type:complete
MIIGKIAKAVLNILLPQMAELLVPVKKYCFEDNELDIKCRELEQKVTDQGFRMTKIIDMVKSRDEIIDNMTADMKKIRNMKVFKKLGK